MNDYSFYSEQLKRVIEQSAVQISTIKPSEWAEQNIVMPKPFPGPFRYSKTPYTREIIDCLSPDHPARWVAVMKGAQIGFSAGVIYPGVGWMIKNNPGNTFITVGAPDLIEKAMEKLDIMIDNAKMRDYIKPQVQRNRMNKSGDTNVKKEFPGGYVTIASANNHKAIRQVDLQYGFFDDFEAVKSASKESGDTRKLLEQRFAAYADSHKIFYISTPELKQNSNIEAAYLLGDQRKYLVPCPCCHEHIELVWDGMRFQVDDSGRVVKGSVGYECPKCAGFFTDRGKYEMLNNGIWKPTTDAKIGGYYSYHISSLYAPIGMYDWEHYANDWAEANPINQPRKEHLYKTFVNVCLGQPYESEATQVDSKNIQRNCREYSPGTIPEQLSISDGNGKFVLLTCASDMNGKVDDARLDYEIVGWTETGASYSIDHGSIGTFIKGENQMRVKVDRERWTYEFDKPKSVWSVFEAIIKKTYVTDTGRQMSILKTGLDCGYFSNNYAYPFMDMVNKFPRLYVAGLKGQAEEKFTPEEKDTRYFKPALERPNLFILMVTKIKDELAEHMQLKWSPGDIQQPAWFMNFPRPENGKYTYTDFFEHFESEVREYQEGANGGILICWRKKRSDVANHMWDCRVYNIAVREIILHELRQAAKLPKLTWREFVVMAKGK